MNDSERLMQDWLGSVPQKRDSGVSLVELLEDFRKLRLDSQNKTIGELVSSNTAKIVAERQSTDEVVIKNQLGMIPEASRIAVLMSLIIRTYLEHSDDTTSSRAASSTRRQPPTVRDRPAAGEGESAFLRPNFWGIPGFASGGKPVEAEKLADATPGGYGLSSLEFTSRVVFPPGQTLQAKWLMILQVSDAGPVVSWDEVPASGLVTILRLVANDDFLPYSADVIVPAAEDLVPGGQTFEVGRLPASATSLTDPYPLSDRQRHYALLAYRGDSLAAACRTDPTVVARGQTMIEALRHVDIQAQGEAVVGSWEAASGVVSVRVHRAKPQVAAHIEESSYLLRSTGVAGEGSPWSDSSQDQVQLSRTSFLDHSVEPGQSYVYSLIARVADPSTGEEADAPAWTTSQPVAVPLVLKPVMDLALVPPGLIELDGGAVSCDLIWSNPLGNVEVRLYCTEHQPSLSKATGQTLPLAELSETGLTEEDRIKLQSSDDPSLPGAKRLHGVPWPKRRQEAADADAYAVGIAYFTPVVVRDRIAAVGPPYKVTRIPPVLDVRLTDRVGRVLVTFAWPFGADEVEVGFRQSSGEEPILFNRTVDRKGYDSVGAFALPGLDRRGEVLVRARLTVDGKKRVGPWSEPMAYPGRVDVSYSLSRGDDGVARVRLKSDRISGGSLKFALAYHPRYLPLTAKDSFANQDVELLPGRIVGADGGGKNVSIPGFTGRSSNAPDPIDLEFDIDQREGLVRLVLVPADSNDKKPRDRGIVLLDPPIDQLRLPPPPPSPPAAGSTATTERGAPVKTREKRRGLFARRGRP
ncbi:MAG: hypothetical protein LBK42_10115 [Propionibacteriaceae bacterium]|jgi:hypothetical protein|nr:hypothetical protein [Propionibacteriaceae bacterium]